ncbi:30S ribosomal protein S2 [archaeon]|nr:30S ribosomal protein S2 [archaeon]
MNIKKIDEQLAAASKLLSNYAENEIVLACRRENGWEVAGLFSRLTGIKILTKRYRPGILTNPSLGEDFIEIKLLIVADPLLDKNVMLDACKLGVPIIGLCDSNNESNCLDLVIPCNNKGRKSLGLAFWIIAKEYLKLRGKIKEDKEIAIPMEGFCKEED